MKKRTLKIVGVRLSQRDIAKADKLAKAQEVSRSEVIRTLIRSKRLPKRPGGILNAG